jgi:APA family basic amino acid/polyamine antiporter
MSTVELAASVGLSGGPYAFARRAFGPFVGLATGITDWLGNVGGIAYVSVVFAEYLHRLGIGTLLPTGLIAALLPLAVCAVQWFGTRVSGRSQEAGSALKALAYGTLIAALLLAPRGAPVSSVHLSPAVHALGLIAAVRAIVGAYSGWNSAAYFCEEVRDPGRALVRGTFMGIGAVIAVYVLMNVALLRVLTPAEMAGGNLVAADAAARVFGTSVLADRVVTAISLIAVVTITNALLMQLPRILFAIGRDAGAPLLSEVAANGTPRIALLSTGVIASLLATIGVYEILLSFSLSLVTAMSMCVNAAAIAVRLKEPGLARPYRMPLFPLPALFSLTVNSLLLAAFVYEDPVTSASAAGLLILITLGLFSLTRMRRPAVA